MSPAPEHLELRRVFAAYPTGVAAVAALVDGVPQGIAASSFVSVSLDPPLVSVCVAHTSTTWPALRLAPRLGISVLAAHQELASRQLSARDSARFAALSWRATDDGAVRICGASAWLDCSIERQIPAGDHDIVLLRVRDVGAADGEVPPLVFHGSSYRRLQPRCGDSDRARTGDLDRARGGDLDRARGGDLDRARGGELDRARGEAPSRLRAG